MAEVSTLFHRYCCCANYVLSLQHVGIRRYSQFLSEVYDLLEDDGVFFLQVAGFRPSWQYEDLIWFVLCTLMRLFIALISPT